MWDVEYQDARAELHREPHPDVASSGECLAEAEYNLELFLGGDEDIPPWLTRDEALAQLEESVEQWREVVEKEKA